MGKGFENYMSKKWFHPTNIENQKRKYLAEQKAADEKKRQMELRQQYEREQEIFSNKQLMGDEKARLGLSFMYNAPTSLKDQKPQDSSENNNESELQLNANASGSSSSNNQAKNIRCLKCKRWGHANTDKTCPLYGKSRLDVEETLDEESVKLTLEEPDVKPSSSELNKELNISRNLETNTSKDEDIEKNDDSDEEDKDLTLDMLRNLSKKEKKVLLKRLRRLAKKIKRSI